MRIFNHDFGGYAFPLQLSEALAQRGHEVLHAYYGSHRTTPPGIDSEKSKSAPNLDIVPVELKRPLDKYNFYRRWRQESEYGRAAAEVMKSFNPDIVLSGNTPLDAQKTLIEVSKKLESAFVFWLQDLLGLAAYDILRGKIPVAGSLVGRYYVALEKKLLKKSELVIAITSDFQPFLSSIPVSPDSISYIQNWAPVDQIPVLSKQNEWSERQGLDDGFCFLYAGTLSMKHDPDALLQLALAFREQPDVRIVVVSSGLGASWLEQEKKHRGLPNLVLFPYQPTASLPKVLATADVTITLLEASAGTYSVPSKVLTYLCAGRPLLMAVPPENQASQLVGSHGAGWIVPPGDTKAFIETARSLKHDAAMRKRAGERARALAEKLFDIERIADIFEDALVKARNR